MYEIVPISHYKKYENLLEYIEFVEAEEIIEEIIEPQFKGFHKIFENIDFGLGFGGRVEINIMNSF